MYSDNESSNSHNDSSNSHYDSDIEQYDDNDLLETISIASHSTSDDDRVDDDDESIIIDDMDDYSDSDDEDDVPEYVTEIYQEDSYHLYREKQDKHYYIGFCKPMHKPRLILMANSVSPNTFFQHSYERIYQYLQNYSTLLLRSPKIEIMQLHITRDDVYSIVIKTHWLRLVQRHWKGIFKKRAAIMQNRMTFHSLYTFEITGNYPYGLRKLPSLYGMMNSYTREIVRQ